MKNVIFSSVLSVFSLAALAAVQEVNPNQIEVVDTEYIVLIGIAILGILAAFCFYYFRRWDDDDRPPQDR
jgi:hypothetical protein